MLYLNSQLALCRAAKQVRHSVMVLKPHSFPELSLYSRLRFAETVRALLQEDILLHHNPALEVLNHLHSFDDSVLPVARAPALDEDLNAALHEAGL